MAQEQLRIITNMTFWQSALWREQTDSIRSPNQRYRESTFGTALSDAWRLYLRRRAYDVVLTMGMRESMCYGLLCLLTGVRSKQIMTEVFIDHAQPERWMWRIKTALYAHIARRAIGIITNSSAEIASTAHRFNLPENRLRFVPLNATIPPEEAQEAAPPYILSAGRTLRDYDTLLQAAPELQVPVVIVCGKQDMSGARIPDNVKVLRELDRSQYLDRLRECAVVALPLQPTERSTGQVVLLEAMAMGKPVITTRAPGTMDYIHDGEDGLLVEHANPRALAQRCKELMASPEERRRIGSTARERVRQRHGNDAHARAKLEAIRALHGAHNTPA